jgi:hypothetical protein
MYRRVRSHLMQETYLFGFLKLFDFIRIIKTKILKNCKNDLVGMHGFMSLWNARIYVPVECSLSRRNPAGLIPGKKSPHISFVNKLYNKRYCVYFEVSSVLQICLSCTIIVILLCIFLGMHYAQFFKRKRKGKVKAIHSLFRNKEKIS